MPCDSSKRRNICGEIIGINFVFHELAETLADLKGGGPRLKALPTVNVFLNCFTVLLVTPSAQGTGLDAAVVD
jgi:hypothetical protein